MIRAFAEFVDNRDLMCLSDDEVQDAVDRWIDEVRTVFLGALRDELSGRFTDKHRAVLKALDLWFNPSLWPSVEVFLQADFGVDEMKVLIDAYSDVQVYTNGTLTISICSNYFDCYFDHFLFFLDQE